MHGQNWDSRSSRWTGFLCRPLFLRPAVASSLSLEDMARRSLLLWWREGGGWQESSR